MRLLPALMMIITLGGCASSHGHLHARTEATASSSRLIRLESSDGDFTEAVPAWNLISPEAKSPDLRWRVGRLTGQTRQWSPWFPVNDTTPIDSDSFAALDIDVIVGRFDTVELKLDSDAEFNGFISITATRPTDGPLPKPSKGTKVVIAVPHRSQRTDDVKLKGRLCSAASLAMVCALYREPLDVSAISREAYDPLHDVYGNWPRNLQAVYGLSGGRLEARFVRFSTFDELRDMLEHGTPVVISVKGTLRGAPYSPTEGHLLVVNGLTADGDVITVDPAFSDPAQANRIYAAKDIAVAWLMNRRGSAYVVTRTASP